MSVRLPLNQLSGSGDPRQNLQVPSGFPALPWEMRRGKLGNRKEPGFAASENPQPLQMANDAKIKKWFLVLVSAAHKLKKKKKSFQAKTKSRTPSKKHSLKMRQQGCLKSSVKTAESSMVQPQRTAGSNALSGFYGRDSQSLSIQQSGSSHC